VKAYPSSVRPLPAAAWRRLRGCPFRCRACDSAGLPPHIESWCRCGARSAGKMSRSPGLTASAGLEPEPGSAPASRFASAAEILRVSGPLPGATHDLTAARIQGPHARTGRQWPSGPGGQGLRRGQRAHPYPYKDRESSPRGRPPTAFNAQLPGPGERATPSSKPGASCANSAAVPGRPGSSPKPSTYFRPARSEDEKRSDDKRRPNRVVRVPHDALLCWEPSDSMSVGRQGSF
jgi:hypothetical protein